jgi:uncharacterized protein YbjQ (UPF0145 family)
VTDRDTRDRRYTTSLPSFAEGSFDRYWRRPRSRLDQALTVARQILDQDLPEETRVLDLDDPVGGGLSVGDLRQLDRMGGRRDDTMVADPPAPSTPGELVFDMRPAEGFGGPSPRPADEPDYGLGRSWGSAWEWATQGWVDENTDKPTWRPVVSTTDALSNWDVDTYLGVVSGDAGVRDTADTSLLGGALARARRLALDTLVEAALARGAHGVVGVDLRYTSAGRRVIVTATGTAVTLRRRS